MKHKISIITGAKASQKYPTRKIMDQLHKFRRQHRLDDLSIREMIEEERH